jgi:MFS family permease
MVKTVVDHAPVAQQDFSWRSDAYAWGVVALLAVAMALSMMDRMVLALLAQQIKADLHLSDVEISLLHGLAFTMLYVTAGLPMGRLADRHSRRIVAGSSIISYSMRPRSLPVHFKAASAARDGSSVSLASFTSMGLLDTTTSAAA